jgi:two-component system response regulator NreC
MITVLLVDDHKTVRRGLKMRLALESDLHIVGESDDAEEALLLAQKLQPDVILMDISMAGDRCVQTVRRFGQVAPGAAVVLLALHTDRDVFRQAREAGARSIVEKKGGTDDLLAAIRNAKRIRA